MHLADVAIGTCEINYCVKARAFSYKGLPPIQKPPYFELPNNAFDDGDSSVERYQVGDDRKTWIVLTPQTLNETAKNQMSSAAILTFEMKMTVVMLSLVHWVSMRGI
ncbi:hypothetical protein MHBO_005261 [Bonamia ostreae]|uniref:Uncharacterized protein n=1 Tax=Bonamia ostreae TaxID=126728 RepID=A0ABV2AVD9_9EUKA